MKYILCLLLAGGISARVAPIESIVGPGAPCIGEECGDNLSNPCSLIKCSNGSHCVPRGTTGRCVLDSNPCASIKCGRGYHCAVENGQGGCVPNVPSEVDLCSLVKCALGGHCENGNCVPAFWREIRCLVLARYSALGICSLLSSAQHVFGFLCVRQAAIVALKEAK
ncbi:Follistatin-like domain-containing protein [Caenorhabditis elegans]|uniref:Follistatin-like domain-containing protein n=1 Tax=Caenorhabditis elegans TaxID=6239 RepID=H9G317_CAEEL|nr:Follistatin-like domain-containing protein [Caenorhabditis elegans]CCG28423.1 Follistatin-like domain-containing protein [Caenorhabditis elegans]|eukprot:NP_001256937.1 Uncharacterized protein CELE_F46B3.14 [Caenorhabditis elegans]